MGARYGVIQFLVAEYCVTLGPSLRGLVENLGAGLNISVNEAFRADSIGSQFLADTANDGITL